MPKKAPTKSAEPLTDYAEDQLRRLREHIERFPNDSDGMCVTAQGRGTPAVHLGRARGIRPCDREVERRRQGRPRAADADVTSPACSADLHRSCRGDVYDENENRQPCSCRCHR